MHMSRPTTSQPAKCRALHFGGPGFEAAASLNKKRCRGIRPAIAQLALIQIKPGLAVSAKKREASQKET